MNEKAFWTKEVAETLQIGASTLRKWCLALENEGYEFVKGAKKSRAFLEKDIVLLRRMKSLIHGTGITVETAIKIALSDDKNNEIEGIVLQDSERTEGRTHSVLSENTLQLQEQMGLEFIENQKKILERLERLEHLEQLEKTNEERLRRIEEKLASRDDQLLQVVREIQDSKKLIASSVEDNKKWWKFW
ncbi:DUF3967 domain-containing protein [Priestia aryabhattai]|uniref:DUF3967 domain-containing protein n=1 Tax=Priestia aryabhattai TaxID=412384 RepID=A0ABD5KZP0_PRIAR